MSPKPERPNLPPPTLRPKDAPLALSGIKVADFSHFIAGPLCSMILADMGAEVIKIEKADGGDDFRRIRPPVTEQEGAAFLWTNRNKKSIALDLNQGGRAAIQLERGAAGSARRQADADTLVAARIHPEFGDRPVALDHVGEAIGV